MATHVRAISLVALLLSPDLVDAACNGDNLLNALRHSSSAPSWCSSYICATPVTTTSYVDTVTPTTYVSRSAVAHPMVLYNLQPGDLTTTSPAITYGSPPTPVPVPPPVQCYGWSGECWVDSRRRDAAAQRAYAEGQQAKREALAARAALLNDARQAPPPTTSCPGAPIPTWLATTYPPSRLSSACSCLLTSQPPAATVYATSTAPAETDTCTTYTSTAPTTTWAAFCDPSLYSNYIASPTIPAGAGAARAEATSPVSNRMGCCEACAETFNCVYWKYTPGTTVTPSPDFPGGFDPWSAGSCVVGYQTNDLADESGFGSSPAVCPNGDTASWMNPASGTNFTFGSYTNLFWNGWQPGTCAGASNIYESNQNCGCDGENECFF